MHWMDTNSELNLSLSCLECVKFGAPIFLPLEPTPKYQRIPDLNQPSASAILI